MLGAEEQTWKGEERVDVMERGWNGMKKKRGRSYRTPPLKVILIYGSRRRLEDKMRFFYER